MYRYYFLDDKKSLSAQANLAKKLLMLTAALTLLAVGITIPTVMLMECKNPSDDPTISTTPPQPDFTLPDINYTGLPGTENPDDITDLSQTTGYFTTEDYITGTEGTYATGTYATGTYETGTYAIETRQSFT